MLDTKTRVVVSHLSRQVVKLTHGDTVAVIEQPAKPLLAVVSIGKQGPVGTVAEEVLSRVEQVELAVSQTHSKAADAKTVSEQTQLDVDLMLTEMTNQFNYHAGAISA